MKQKIEVIVLVVFVIVAALVWTYERNSQTPAAQTASSIEKYQVLAVENPQIRWDELGRAQRTEYKSNGRNPFSMIAPPTPDELKAKKDHENLIAKQPPPPPPPPPTTAPPPANLKFFGYGAVPVGSTRRAFFTDSEDIYIVPEGETLLGRYRILRVGTADLEFQEISSGLHGRMPLEEQAAPPPSP